MSALWMAACTLFGIAVGLLLGHRLTRPRRLPPATARQLKQAQAKRLELPADKPAVSQRLDSVAGRISTPLPRTNFDDGDTES